jgi:hypothetical protein
MPFDTYIQHLRELESKSVRYESPADSSAFTINIDDRVLLRRTHRSMPIRFVSIGLAQVYHDRTPIEGWDENDFAYIGVIIDALSTDMLRLEDVCWSSDSERGHQHTTKATRFVAMAIGTHMKTVRDDPGLVPESDEDVGMNNDNAYLCGVLGFMDARNPLVVYDPYLHWDPEDH